MILLSFSVFLILFVLIGILSATRSKGTNADYLLAGHSIPPWLVALSAVSTNNSGYMFVGQIGFTYLQGLSSIWLMIGWILGDFIASLFIHKKIRLVTEKQNLLSYGGVLARWHGTDYRKFRFLVGVITILFLGTYAAAQFKAGSKALHVLFGWDYSSGAIMGSAIVFLYCLAGGIRASIWTDAAQSLVMIFAMGMLFFVSISSIGGVLAFGESLNAVSPTYLNWFPAGLELTSFAGPTLFVLGWIFAGFGVVGQPHIMIRFMTLDQPKDFVKVRIYYYAWYISFYLLAIGVGLAARVLLPEVQNFDAELALPRLSEMMLPSVLVGVVLAGIFAATMSTADSQILSCSAALTRDVVRRKNENPVITKLATLLVTLSALMISLFGGESVFTLVLIAWSILGSAFGPILFLYAIGRKLSENTLISMLLTGVFTTILWRHLGLGIYIYEIFPGMITPFFVYGFANVGTIKRLTPN